MTTIFIGDKPMRCEIDLRGHFGPLNHIWDFVTRNSQPSLLQYEDDEGDVVTVSSDAELREAIQLYHQMGKPLRLEVSGDLSSSEMSTGSPVSISHSNSDTTLGDDYELCSSALFTAPANDDLDLSSSTVTLPEQKSEKFVLPELPWLADYKQAAQASFQDVFNQRMQVHRQLFDEQHARLVNELETSLHALRESMEAKSQDKSHEEKTRLQADFLRQAQQLHEKFRGNLWILQDRCVRFLSHIPTCPFLAPVTMPIYLVRRTPFSNARQAAVTPLVPNATSVYTLSVVMNCTDSIGEIRHAVRQKLSEQGFLRAAEAVGRTRVLLFKYNKHRVDPDSKKSTWQRLLTSNRDDKPIYEMRPERLPYDDENVRVGDLGLTTKCYATMEGLFDEKMFVRTRRGDSISELPPLSVPRGSINQAPLSSQNTSIVSSSSTSLATAPMNEDKRCASGAAVISSLSQSSLTTDTHLTTPVKMPLSAVGATSPVLASSAAAVADPASCVANMTPFVTVTVVPSQDKKDAAPSVNGEVKQTTKPTAVPSCLPLCAATTAVSFSTLPPLSTHGNSNSNRIHGSHSRGELIRPPLSPTEQSRLDNQLAIAVGEKDVNRVRRAVEQGANINCVLAGGHGWSPLQKAARLGTLAVVSFFLSRPEVRVNAQDMYGWTALMRAAKENHVHVVRLLLQKKADVTLMNESGKTALQIARECYFQRVVDLLEGRMQLYSKPPTGNTPGGAGVEIVEDPQEEDLVLLDGDELAESRVQGAFEVNSKRKRRNSLKNLLSREPKTAEDYLAAGNKAQADPRGRATSAPLNALATGSQINEPVVASASPMEDSVELP